MSAKIMRVQADMLRHMSLSLYKAGVPFPGKLPPITDEDRFPLDITTVSNAEVRRLMSFWTAQYAYVNALLGKEKGKVMYYTRHLNRRKSILFQKLKPEKKTGDWSEAIQGRIQLDPKVKRYEVTLAKAESMVSVYEPLVWDFRAYADVASREITARISEMGLEGRSPNRKRFSK